MRKEMSLTQGVATNTPQRVDEVLVDIVNNPACDSPAVNVQERIRASIDAEVQKSAEAASKPQQPPSSFLKVSSFRQYVDEGLLMETPDELFPRAATRGETTILFGDTGLGKSILAMQMAIDMAERGERVLYVNFELSQQQLAKRFPQKEIPQSLYIANIDYALMHDVTDQGQILGEIEHMALMYQANVLFIDNLTNLCVNSKDGAEAGNIMLKLLALRMTHQLTMVVLAHVPKRKAIDPLTLNDLAGSKQISNMVDIVLGLNASKKDKNMRYLKQLKYRSRPIELDYKNVQELTLSKSDGYLHFEFGGYDEERAHLPRSRDEKEELENDILAELRKPNGLSYREIAEKLGTSPSTVCRIAKAANLNPGKQKV